MFRHFVSRIFINLLNNEKKCMYIKCIARRTHALSNITKLKAAGV